MKMKSTFTLISMILPVAKLDDAVPNVQEQGS